MLTPRRESRSDHGRLDPRGGRGVRRRSGGSLGGEKVTSLRNCGGGDGGSLLEGRVGPGRRVGGHRSR